MPSSSGVFVLWKRRLQVAIYFAYFLEGTFELCRNFANVYCVFNEYDFNGGEIAEKARILILNNIW